LNQPLGSALVNSVGALPLMSISSQLASGMESIAPYSSQAFTGLQTNATEPAGQLLNVILTDVAEGDALLGEYLPMSPMMAVATLLTEAQASLASVAEGLVVQQIPSIPTNSDELMAGLESAISFIPKETAGVLLNTLETLPSSAAENGLLGDAGLLAGLQAEMTEIPQSLSEALSADGETLAASLMNLSGQFSALTPAELTGLLTDLQTNEFPPAELANALTSTQAAIEDGRAQLGF
jgi:hypothetical protein